MVILSLHAASRISKHIAFTHGLTLLKLLRAIGQDDEVDDEDQDRTDEAVDSRHATSSRAWAIDQQLSVSPRGQTDQAAAIMLDDQLQKPPQTTGWTTRPLVNASLVATSHRLSSSRLPIQ